MDVIFTLKNDLKLDFYKNKNTHEGVELMYALKNTAAPFLHTQIIYAIMPNSFLLI